MIADGRTRKMAMIFREGHYARRQHGKTHLENPYNMEEEPEHHEMWLRGWAHRQNGERYYNDLHQ